MGKTILISSHILPELQDLCNTVGIIERGELIYSGPWTDIVKRASAIMLTGAQGARHDLTFQWISRPAAGQSR